MYAAFFANTKFVTKPLSKITIPDICEFLDNAHKNGISKQRHGAIGTIFHKVYKYSARYLNDPVINLFDALDYTEWRYII